MSDPDYLDDPNLCPICHQYGCVSSRGADCPESEKLWEEFRRQPTDKAFVYRGEEFLGCVTPTEGDCDKAGNWRSAALAAARAAFGPGALHVTSAPCEQD